MSASQSDSKSTSNVATTNITDSYNQTYSMVSNLSDVGNVKFMMGDAGAAPIPSFNTFLPIIVGLFALLGFFIIVRK